MQNGEGGQGETEGGRGEEGLTFYSVKERNAATERLLEL